MFLVAQEVYCFNKWRKLKGQKFGSFAVPNATSFYPSSLISLFTAVAVATLLFKVGGLKSFSNFSSKKQPSAFEALPEKAAVEFRKFSEKNSEVNVEGGNFEFNEELEIGKACYGSFVMEKIDSSKGKRSSEKDSLPTSNPDPRDTKFQHRPVGSLNGPIEIGDSSGKRKVEENLEINAQVFYSNVHSRFWETKAKEIEDMNRLPAYDGTPRILMGEIQASSYPDTGPLNCNPNPSRINYDYSSKRKTADGSDRVELLEQDRAELLRKLDELRDQLKRSCEVSEESKQRFPMNNMSASSSTYVQNGRSSLRPDCTSSLNRNSSHHSPFANAPNVDLPRYYPAADMQDGVRAYREASRFAPFNNHCQYAQRAHNNYIYKHFDPDPVISYHNDGFYHQPACACMHCHNGHWLSPAQIPASVLSNPRIPPCSLGSHGFYAVDGSSMFGPQSYNHRLSKVPSHPFEPCNEHKFTFTRKECRPCQPVAGAAPFIICFNCSELLQIPEQIMRIGKHQCKLRCGSCSQLISFELDGARLISSNSISILPSTTVNNIDLHDGSKDVLQCHGNTNRRQVISYSIDYGSPNFSDEKIAMPSFPVSSTRTKERESGLNLSGSEKLHRNCSSSSTSDGVRSPDSVVCQKDAPSSIEIPIEGDAIIRVPSLPLHEHFGYSSGNQVGDDHGSVSMSKHSDQEKVTSFKGNFKHYSVKDVPVATEMDFSTEGYPNDGFSQDSWDVSKVEEVPRFSKGGDSFIGGLIKKSLKDFSRFNQSSESGRSKVSVNGHYISDRMVKRAEKLAGPIHTGDYWYDYRAGFWGVMGHACLGIIPAFIEEFNYPIHKNCASGNTGVLVNGRELNSRDLSLLANRGLPVTEGQSYIIDISGKVWDEESGEELDGLGKLAPTVERVKRGFGMRAPRVSS